MSANVTHTQVGWKLYVPNAYVSQSSLESFDEVSEGKYTKGLGQTSMSVAEPCEDIVSMMLTATNDLLEQANIDPSEVGRLEVGTETLVDKSKSTKTSLMRLFGEANGDIEGVDTINACYGGTNALFNCLHWMSSPSWDGRYAIVVCGDIAVYEQGPARPTGGAGAIAMLIGPKAPIGFNLADPRATHMEDVYDFYKPIGHHASEYPQVDGHLSNTCYHRSIDRCVERLAKKCALKHKHDFDIRNFDHAIFHYPYGKLVQKSYGRYLWNQHRLFRNVDDSLNKFLDLPEEDTYGNRELDKLCNQIADYDNKVLPSTRLGREIGNIYTGSLYAGLMSLVEEKGKDLDGERAILFSYGSGSAATMFSTTFRDESKLEKLRQMGDVDRILQDREEVDPVEFTETLKQREQVYGTYPIQVPKSERMRSGAYYLTSVDNLGRRQYARAYSTLRHLGRRVLRR